MGQQEITFYMCQAMASKACQILLKDSLKMGLASQVLASSYTLHSVARQETEGTLLTAEEGQEEDTDCQSAQHPLGQRLAK